MSEDVEQRVMEQQRNQPPTPANPYFIIDVGGDFAVGTVFTSRERAERVAEQMGIGNYTIREDAA